MYRTTTIEPEFQNYIRVLYAGLISTNMLIITDIYAKPIRPHQGFCTCSHGNTKSWDKGGDKK